MKKILSFKRSGSSAGSANNNNNNNNAGNRGDHDESGSLNSLSNSSHSSSSRYRHYLSRLSLDDHEVSDAPASINVHSDFKSFTYSSKSNSLFSKDARTMSTLLTSSRDSSLSNSKQALSTQQQLLQHRIMNIGRPLRVLVEDDSEEEEQLEAARELSGRAGAKGVDIKPGSKKSLEDHRSAEEQLSSYQSQANSLLLLSLSEAATSATGLDQVLFRIDKELKNLLTELKNIILQRNQSVLNLTKSSIQVSDAIKQTITNLQNNSKLLSSLPPLYLNTWNHSNLRKLVKIVLYLVDNLLNEDVYTNSRVLILKVFDDLLQELKLTPTSSTQDDLINYNTRLQPKLFTLGSTAQLFPNEDKIDTILTSLVNSKRTLILDQEGSFIAPVLRGFYNENLSCITFMFGFPKLENEHKQIINNVFYSLIEDFHFMYQENSIQLLRTTEFKAPFRIPTNSNEPPISISISSENSTSVSGTLGGYIYPKIDKKAVRNKNLLKYADSCFGMTCAHVVLQDNISDEDEYPYVSCPSPVLINLYKRALSNERSKYRAESEEFSAYDKVIKQIDTLFPPKELKLPTSSGIKSVQRNVAALKFGQIIWGERIINSDTVKLSDLLIIKVSEGLKCLNYLGDDINFNEYDPSLMFGNLYLKKIVDISKLKKASRGAMASVPGPRTGASSAGSGGGLPVFKYGSTTKYTTGNLNGSKIIYWSDGKLQTSEFVIRSNDCKSLSFASGGDSGSWILSKCSDIAEYDSGLGFNLILNRPLQQQHSQQQLGLGVVGMLHSYDGEFKQFGLYTPMVDILDRLKNVTGLEWGVIGCDEESQGVDEDVLTEGELDGRSIGSKSSNEID